MELLTTAQMRAVEAAVMDAGRVTGLALMERAGEAVVAAILAERGDGRPARAAVLCGPGNNGGDGYVIARLLRDRGWEVDLRAFGLPATPDAAEMRRRWLMLPEARVDDDPARWQSRPFRCEVLVDALFGIGLRRPILGLPALRETVAAARPEIGLLVAVDVPSGMEADSGAILEDGEGAYFHPADLTVTFQRAKPGHLAAPEPCGRLRVTDIGLEAEARAAGPVLAHHTPRGDALDKRQGHKFAHGHVLVLSGGVGRGGAARLAARAALRSGAGLVTLGCPPAALIENAARLDAVMLRPLRDAAALAAMLEDPRVNALCLGPGLGVERAAGLLPAALASGRPAVIDADALTALAASGARAHPLCVLTPHEGEFARLFPDLAALPPVEGVRAAAARADAVVLRKGPMTLIAAPDGRVEAAVATGAAAAPWLATAGAGDVLSGLIAGLLARRLWEGEAPFRAAVEGALLHQAAARRFGPGLIAEDLPEALPAVFRDLGL